jgi:hypothetical protein
MPFEVMIAASDGSTVRFSFTDAPCPSRQPVQRMVARSLHAAHLARWNIGIVTPLTAARGLAVDIEPARAERAVIAGW